MAAITNQVSATYSVQGRVFNSTIKDGIAGLIVTVYALNDLNNVIERTVVDGLDALLKNATRVGSVLSNEAGTFVLNYDKDDIVVPHSEERRLDLLVVVSAPDDENGSVEKVMYYSNPPRLNAGRVESFNIGISHDTLQKFGLSDASHVKEHLASYKRERTGERVLTESIAEFHRADIKRATEEKAVLRAELLNTIATDVRVATLPGELVLDNGNIKEKVEAVTDKGVTLANTQINRNRGVPVNLFLTQKDRDRLRPYFNNAVKGFATIPEHELQDILFRKNSSENPGTLLVHNNPVAKFCTEQTFEEKCARIHTGISEDTEHHDDPVHPGDEEPGTITGPNVETLTNDDIPKYVARLLNSAPSPDSVLTPEFNSQHADARTVEDAVEAFSLRKGPADVPAFHDFHSLQIAFEHVWKILIDEDIVNTAHSLDQSYRRKTGVGLKDVFTDVSAGLSAGSEMVYESIPREVPAEVAAQFDITLQEWIDLSASHEIKLKEIAQSLARASELPSTGNLVTGFRRGSFATEKRLQDLREQGERLIDSVRHDDYYTLHKTLRELHNRINSNYEFTVFAADKNHHSVNFGLLNTYRQEMAPLNYQAGQLIKTIPLSPKEERKYSVKTTRTLKQATKEARKNNSVLKSEQRSTTRVEAEIMEKAQNKTNFGLNTDGTFNIGISKGKSTTTFGVEALQESSGSRKDLREALLSAVQEYSDEMNYQVDAEETMSSEYNESGTISNPSEEKTATFLFYQLQRRYRVSEQLYRVLPVVLVAQEVPAPHQITESWVIAHDWILNRHLLDDSFRKALQYLANKSVGDDFALRELRKNLRQQRNLVDTLRLELSVASNQARNRYRALENLIEKRIVEESDESTDGFLSDVGDFFGGGGQDPEAAKARELAAKDAHQYMVEKQEKAAAALRQEMGGLHALTAEYNKTLRDHLDNETCVKRLLVHLRNNIFYYMQAIWSMEPPDQRFLRLHKVQVPQLELSTLPDPNNPNATIPDRSYQVQVLASEDIFETLRVPGTTKHKAFMSGRLQQITEFKPLVEVADLDNLLGFKGNYMIFPLKEHNALTEFMAAPYVDAAFGAMDPDELSNVNLSDYGKYVCCLHEKLPPAKFEALKPKLKKWLELLLSDPLRNGDEVVVPTDSLFIEVLTGTHTLLENFKLRHRELDVYKVQEEVRKAGLEALRLASRLINGEREDPDIEKKIVIKGNAGPVIDVDN
jgi:hypothetical protein